MNAFFASKRINSISISLEQEEQYAKWMAACRLASKGRSLADSTYDSEVNSIKSFLSMQKPTHSPVVSVNPDSIESSDFLSPRVYKKLKGKVCNQRKIGNLCGNDEISGIFFFFLEYTQATSRILEAHANVKELGLIDAKLKFIQAWQSLPEYGVTLFVIKFDGHKKEELLGVAHNRIMRMDVNNGDHLKTWRYNTMKVNRI